MITVLAAASVLRVTEESQCIVYFLWARTKRFCGRHPDRPVFTVTTLTIPRTQENRRFSKKNITRVKQMLF